MVLRNNPRPIPQTSRAFLYCSTVFFPYPFHQRFFFGKGVPSFTKPGFFWTSQGVLKTAQVHGVENGQKQLGAGALQGPRIVATGLILLCFLFGKATWVCSRSFSIAMGGTYTTKVNCNYSLLQSDAFLENVIFFLKRIRKHIVQFPWMLNLLPPPTQKKQES